MQFKTVRVHPKHKLGLSLALRQGREELRTEREGLFCGLGDEVCLRYKESRRLQGKSRQTGADFGGTSIHALTRVVQSIAVERRSVTVQERAFLQLFPLGCQVDFQQSGQSFEGKFGHSVFRQAKVKRWSMA